jgi:hypothetical protein
LITFGKMRRASTFAILIHISQRARTSLLLTRNAPY